ncbi:transposase [Pandoraea eparura]|uniref:Transposase n=1 Tax=Pandoraea eparura TaxID=2508291 RepID=A0A5E4XLT8_9BURK|nr:transposase [Pandoraea eparura]
MEVMTRPERRRRRTAEQKLAMVRKRFEPGKSVSMVARQHGVNPNQLFHWCVALERIGTPGARGHMARQAAIQTDRRCGGNG